MSEMNMVTILIIIVIINDIDSGIVGRVLVCLKMRADTFKMITVAIVMIIMNISIIMIISIINLIMVKVGVFVRLISRDDHFGHNIIIFNTILNIHMIITIMHC